MKEHLNFCTTITTLVTLMISGSGCAQTYVPRRYYGTTYTTVPRVYTSQPVVTYSHPVVTYSQPPVTYRTPTYQYRTTYTTAAQPYNQTAALRTASSMYDANTRAAEISRQIERRTAEIEARVKRRTQEIEERARRQTEEIERQVARQTAEASRQVAQSTRRPTCVATAISSPSTTRNLTYTKSSWMGELPPSVTHYPHVRLGGGFAPHVFCNDMSALLVWPVSAGDDVGDAVRNLVAVKNDLRRTEPNATLGMILLVCSGRVPNEDKWLVQGVRCLDASLFSSFSARFFSQAASQSSSIGDVSEGAATTYNESCESDGESSLDAIVAKVKEWGAIATNFLETAPWWVWAIGAVLVFIVVFAVCVKDANSQPFQENGDDPWVVDPSGR